MLERNMIFNNIRIIAMLLLSLSALNTEIIDRRQLKQGYLNNAPDTSVLKVTLTQKGYIQFLQYIADVPTISEFTFCIWLKSINLTYSHPLLSYSRRNTERLIRSWVTPGGKSLSLEILENEIFNVPVELAENRWYHICQSWLSLTGAWIVFIDGQAKAIGFNEKMRSVKIPRGGEIVVGQEYTDFDKGLDDGIEGDIYGFNLVLASASMRSVKIPRGGEIVVGQEYTDFDKGLDDGIEGDIYGFNLVLASASPTVTVSEKPAPPLYLHQTDVGLRRQLHLQAPVLRSKRPLNIYRGSTTQINSHAYDPNYNANLTPPKADGFQITTEPADVPEVLSYFDTNVNVREAKGIFSDLGKGVLNMFNDYESEKPLRLKTSLAELTNTPTQHQVEQFNYGFYAPKHSSYVLQDGYNSRYSQQHQLHSPKRIFPTNNRILHNQKVGLNAKPLGLMLVELSYRILHNQKVGLNAKPLGLMLVELSYGNCALGKGSPVNDKRLLISWTKTPVRVFGGAVGLTRKR
ncbi:Pentaxin family [Popillia japonica]|uniref:Pentaxin family n=1 Tax=Popillia japonica TaxID=7064 RepID=A0AAW1L6Y9_POPJA